MSMWFKPKKPLGGPGPTYREKAARMQRGECPECGSKDNVRSLGESGDLECAQCVLAWRPLPKQIRPNNGDGLMAFA